MGVKLNFFGYIDNGLVSGIAVTSKGNHTGIIDTDKGTIDCLRFKKHIDTHASLKGVHIEDLKTHVFDEKYKLGGVRNVFLVNSEGDMYWGTRTTKTLKKIEIKMIDFYINLGYEESK